MTVVVLVLLAAGTFFLGVSAVGLQRLPDFYARTHAAGKSETLGAILLLGGMALHLGLENTSAKLLVIVAIVAVANPAGVHALTRAAVRSGLEIWTGPAEERRP